MAEQVGVRSSSAISTHAHSNINTGGQLDPDIALNPAIVTDFGDGSDGNIIIGVDTDLTRDMSYNNLTVLAGFTLRNLGFKIKVRNLLTVDVGGIISGKGADGSNGAAGVGGVGGIAIINRRPNTCLPTSGGQGGNGGGAGVNVAAGGIPPDIDVVNAITVFEGRLWAGGGGGGGGGKGTTPTAGGVPLRVLAGAKGGRGSNGLHVAGNHNLGGGGGGAGGCLVEIWTREIDNNGIITAAGGDGGNGQDGGGGNESGGGAGGGGGAIIIYYKAVSGGGLGTRVVDYGDVGLYGDFTAWPIIGFSYAQQIGV